MCDENSKSGVCIAEILAMKVEQLTLGTAKTSSVLAEYIEKSGLLKEYEGVGYEHPECERLWEERKQKENIVRDTFTVSDFIKVYGNMPRGTKTRCDASRGVVHLRKKLLSLGMTPFDWPMLGESLPEIYQANIDRCYGDKEKIVQLSIEVLNIYSTTAQAFTDYFHRLNGTVWEERFPRINIGQMLTLSIRDDGYHIRVEGFDVTHSIKKIRSQLRSIGFDHADGVFLLRIDWSDEVKKVANDLGISEDLASKYTEYFRGKFVK